MKNQWMPIPELLQTDIQITRGLGDNLTVTNHQMSTLFAFTCMKMESSGTFHLVNGSPWSVPKTWPEPPDANSAGLLEGS
jgi:hypothetical protein